MTAATGGCERGQGPVCKPQSARGGSVRGWWPLRPRAPRPGCGRAWRWGFCLPRLFSSPVTAAQRGLSGDGQGRCPWGSSVCSDVPTAPCPGPSLCFCLRTPYPHGGRRARVDRACAGDGRKRRIHGSGTRLFRKGSALVRVGLSVRVRVCPETHTYRGKQNYICLPLSGAYLSYAFVLSREALVHSSLLGSCKSCYHLFKHFFSGWKTTQCLPNAKGPQRILYPPGETPPVSLSLTVKRTTFPNPMTMEGWFPF